MEDIGPKIKTRRLALGLSQDQLAEAAGTSQTSIDRIEKSQFKRMPAALPMILHKLGMEADMQSLLKSGPTDIGRFKPEVTPGADLVGSRGFPIYAAAEGGNGNILITHDVIERVKWPSILEGVRDAYGMRIIGESMEPAFFQGDMALVHPALPPQRGKNAILYSHDNADGDAEAIVKTLVGWSDREWHLRQYNPPRDWKEFKADWPTCHMIVGKYDAR